MANLVMPALLPAAYQAGFRDFKAYREAGDKDESVRAASCAPKSFEAFSSSRYRGLSVVVVTALEAVPLRLTAESFPEGSCASHDTNQ